MSYVWTKRATTSSIFAYCSVASDSSGQKLVLLSRNEGAYTSTNGGINWEPLSSIGELLIKE